ncbi:Uncharacterised protein [Enterobacter cloacae]|nr:Uncharacterised protein [Enterobacter cloacae]
MKHMPGVYRRDGMRIVRKGVAHLDFSFGESFYSRHVLPAPCLESQRNVSLATGRYSSTFEESLTIS